MQNRALVLKMLATVGNLSRVDLANLTGLSKMTVGNIISELISQNLVEEDLSETDDKILSPLGRPAIKLKLSSLSPCICGMLIKRGFCQVIIADLGGKVLDQVTYPYIGEISANNLTNMLLDGFFLLKNRSNRRLIAVSISSIGPVDIISGILLNPPAFYNIENLHIVDIIKEATSLPAYLINDANAGVLAEMLYGVGMNDSNFMYLHIMNGIGAGLVLMEKLYNGNLGQSGEIGHTSINYSGPKCSCGNVGCLDLYASVENMTKRARSLSGFYENSKLATIYNPTWLNIVDNASMGDPVAITVLSEFCDYTAQALINVLNILDLTLVIVGYDRTYNKDIVEKILQEKITSSVLYSKYRSIRFVHSTFNGEAPLIGSIANVADKVFNLEIEIQ